MKEKFVGLIDSVASKFGYSREKYNAVNSQNSQIQGLVKAVGDFQARHEIDTVVVAALIALTGEESIELTLAYLAEIQKQNLIVLQESDDEKLILTLAIADNDETEIEFCDTEEEFDSEE